MPITLDAIRGGLEAHTTLRYWDCGGHDDMAAALTSLRTCDEKHAAIWAACLVLNSTVSS
jgi:hypothetical protein